MSAKDESAWAGVFNTTPHNIVVYDEKGEEIRHTIPANSDYQLRVKTAKLKPAGHLFTPQGDLPLCEPMQYESFDDKKIEMLRQCAEAKAIVIASDIAARAILNLDLPEGLKLLVPCTDTQSVVRGEKGQILGVSYLENRTALLQPGPKKKRRVEKKE